MRTRVPIKMLDQSGFIHILLSVACFVLVGVIGIGMVISSRAAPAVHWQGVIEAFSSGSGYCLSSSGSTTGSSVVLDPCKSSDNNQVWKLTYTKTATVMGETTVQEFYLQNGAGTNECLTNPSGTTTNGTSMQLGTCSTASTADTWAWGIKFTSLRLSSHQLLNLATVSGTSGLCLDDTKGAKTSGNKVEDYTCKTTGQSNQEWFEGSAPAAVHYVALGDSVASGEGINYGWTYTNGSWKMTGPNNPIWEPTTNLSAAVQDCHRSAQAYPYLISSAKNYQLLDLSCSGATIPAGVLGPIQFTKTTSGAAQVGYNKTVAGYSAPNTAYDAFKPNLVTITLGMDDVDFSDVLTNCYTGPCGTTSQNQSMDTSIATFSTNLKTLLTEINNRGTADGQVPWVVLTTYYDPLNPSALSCGDINLGLGFGLSSSDVSWLQSKLTLISEDIQADSTTYPKVKVVDLTNVMSGHAFCSSNPWVYGPSILFDNSNSPAPFHPTPSGQQAIANAMLTTINSLSL